MFYYIVLAGNVYSHTIPLFIQRIITLTEKYCPPINITFYKGNTWINFKTFEQ